MTTPEQADLAAMIDALAAGSQPSDERPAEVAALRTRLADQGVWTLGVPEALGGGGADDALTATAFARLGRRWAALGWASVQAHAAAELLGDHPLRAMVHNGQIAVGVTGGLRVDAAGEEPYVIVLGGDTARLHEPDALRYQAVRHTGLDGALTRMVEFVGEGTELRGDVDRAVVRLRLGAAAVAAGIADAAAEAALGYSLTRQQFGGPLTALPTVRDALFGASGTAAVLDRVLSGAASPWQAAAVLDLACEAAIDVTARAVQAHGGYGYLAEYPVQGLLCDAVSLRAAVDSVSARRDGALELVRVRATKIE
ncbi:acyl-CoA dehydrogenase [Amycolatopsis jejuensis]|uniref:acyl-CoA dehydrogenase n=1 Tax=Amycolatopsis jejuensis TaxID=330084 RepID=UPI0005243B7B|nr:acyl-CoA dehydrogenase [Amycolatopsis jejuensis]